MIPPRCASGCLHTDFSFGVWGLAFWHHDGELTDARAACPNLRGAPSPFPVQSTGRQQRGECCAVLGGVTIVEKATASKCMGLRAGYTRRVALSSSAVHIGRSFILVRLCVVLVLRCSRSLCSSCL